MTFIYLGKYLRGILMKNQDVIHLLNQRIRYIQKSLNDKLKKFGLYNAQWTILFSLKKNGAMTQTEIMRYLNVEAPTVTRTIRRMEDNGWVKKVRGKDKRERRIELTETAKLKYDEIEQTVANHDQAMLNQLTDEEKDTLYQLLKKLG